MGEELVRVLESIIERKIKEAVQKISGVDVGSLLKRIEDLENRVNRIYSLLTSIIPSYLGSTVEEGVGERPEETGEGGFAETSSMAESSKEATLGEEEIIANELVAELKMIERELSDLEERHKSGEITNEEYEKRKVELEARRVTLKELLDEEE
ncbi:MAG: SHOCT domain-containing protein [Candidatus Baldrarchaeia archaeon]